MEKNLADLKSYLLSNNYPEYLIDQKFHNAFLQGPANKPKRDTIIPLVSTYFSNYCNKNIKEIAENLIKNSTSDRLKNAF